MTQVLVTDDEVVALAAKADGAWPVPLPTVERQPDVLRVSGMRGIRSLAVRGLADTGTPGAVLYDEGLVDLVSSITRAEDRVLAFVARRDGIFQPRGALVGAFRASGESWIIDSMTGNGVHAIWGGPASEAAEAIARFAQAVWESGVSSPEGSEALGLVVASSDDSKPVRFVAKGQVSDLSVVPGEPPMVFEAGDREEPLSQEEVAELFG